MRAESRQTPVSERRDPRPKDSPKGHRTRSAPQAQIADAPSEVPSSPSVTEPMLLLPQAASQFRSRWEIIQSEFVDDPRHAVNKPVRWWRSFGPVDRRFAKAGTPAA
jgi:hypothetical protein